MLKKYRRITGLLMAFVMAFLLSAPTAVRAIEVIGEDVFSAEMIGSFDVAICSLSGMQIPDTLRQSLRSNGIQVNEDTLVEVIPSNLSDSATALQITNVNGTQVSQDMVLAIKDNGEIGTFWVAPGGDVSVCSNNNGGMVDPIQDGTLVLTLNAVYNLPISHTQEPIFWSYYVQPVSVRFKYQDPGNVHTVSRVYLDYYCQGYEHECDDNLSPVESGNVLYEHSVILSKGGAVNGIYYTRSNPYNTERAIYLYSSNATHQIDWEITIDGRTYIGTWWLTYL